jgi:hypothetical protein
MEGTPTALIIIYLAIILLIIVSLWIMVSKAGRPGVSQILSWSGYRGNHSGGWY